MNLLNNLEQKILQGLNTASAVENALKCRLGNDVQTDIRIVTVFVARPACPDITMDIKEDNDGIKAYCHYSDGTMVYKLGKAPEISQIAKFITLFCEVFKEQGYKVWKIVALGE